MTDWPEGYERVLLASVDSTNEEARRRAPTFATPQWIMAQVQTCGRGRRGREWVSQSGNLFATLLIRHRTRPAEAARLSFHSALAVADALRVLAPTGSIAVKWPNDVLLNGRKISGILLESLGEAAPGHITLAIGFGINLKCAPEVEDAAFAPTSVLRETGRRIDPEHALTVLARRFDHWLEQDRMFGFAPVRDAWRSRAIGVGAPIDVRLADRTLSGTFRDVDADGMLVLEHAGGLQTIAAGDVFFPRPS